MNAQKYTQKSLEAVQNAQSIATEYGNQQIEQPHLLLALLLDEGGLIPQLLGNMGLTVPSFTAAAKAEVEKLPRGYWGYEAEPYDALMSFYEPGTTVQQMDRLADELKHFVIDLFQTLQARGMPCGEPAEGRFRLPLEEQRALSQYVLETIGFDFASGRLDEGPHPTTLAASPGDVRVITSYQAEDFRSGLFNTLHEGGMGLYEQDIDPRPG